MAENVGPFKGRLMFGKQADGSYVAIAVDASGKLQQAPSGSLTPLGYQQIASPVAATALAVPAGATVAIISVSSQAVRWRDDGTNPTAAVGMPLSVGSSMTYTGNLAAIKFIQQAVNATLDVSYYK